MRFPEFRDDEGWNEKTLKDVAQFYKGKGLPKNEISDKGLNYCVHYGELFTKYSEVINEVYSKTDVGNCFLSRTNDVLMPTSDVTPNGLAKACCINLDNIQLGGDIIIIRTDPKDIIGEFLSRYIRHKERDVLKLVSGTTVFHLYSSSLENLLLSFPNKFEQEKIADCLGSLDDLISAVADKIETLKEYKKGLMQQLFPAEGKTTPTLRFPEFQNAGEWRDTTLGEEVYYENGKAHENDIDEAGQYIVVNSKFISTDGEVIKYTDSPSCLADKGDILMVLSDVPNGRAIAKCFIVDRDNKYTVNQRICKLKPKKAVGLLLYYIINRNPFLLAFDDGIKQTNLKKDDVLNCPFRVPKDPKEKQRIADCLLAVDELTSAEADKLNQLKAHKKGLMQQLFPTINE